MLGLASRKEALGCVTGSNVGSNRHSLTLCTEQSFPWRQPLPGPPRSKWCRGSCSCTLRVPEWKASGRVGPTGSSGWRRSPGSALSTRDVFAAGAISAPACGPESHRCPDEPAETQDYRHGPRLPGQGGEATLLPRTDRPDDRMVHVRSPPDTVRRLTPPVSGLPGVLRRSRTAPAAENLLTRNA